MIDMKNITLTFNKNTVYNLDLFNDLSLTIRDGDFISVIGSNGAGKSTLLNLLTGSLFPDEGEIEVLHRYKFILKLCGNFLGGAKYLV